MPEQALDDLTALAAAICQAPISLISLIDENRQWFKANIGMPAMETSRDISFCGHTILQPGLLIVADAANDVRFADNPLVTDDPAIRFYAGAPLITEDGHALGALCVMDRVARGLDATQQEALRVLSRQVMAQLELRRQTRILMESEAKLLSVFHNCPVAFAIIRWDNKKFVDVNSAFTQLIGYSTAEVLGHRDSAQRGASLVQQVLSFAKGVEGRHVTVNPITVISDLVKVTKETFPKSVTVQFNSGPDLWSISADPTQMHQVFLNLCINARDAMPHGGTLTITLENIVLDDTYAAMNIDARPGAYVVVTVADTGTGIPPEVRERIFEPFFTTKEVGKGTGLGLSTAMAILKSHFGFINVYSEPGGGTKFKVYLPANTTVAAADEVAVEQTKLPRGRGELILVVDDEEAVRDIVQAALERFGYRVMLATNGAEAVALYAQHRAAISVVLMDMAMPVMDGPSTIIALRSVNPQVRVIASSGLASDGRVAIALGAGVRHFLPKPYTAEAILKMLKEVLAESGESTAP